MRTADVLMIGLIECVARWTKSHGLAILVAALVVKLLLLPLDWQQRCELRKQRGLQPELERIREEFTDYRVFRHDVRKLFADSGIRPDRTLATALIQVPVFVVVFLVLQATPVFAGRQFLWIADLSVPGQGIPVLPLALAASIWLYGKTLSRAKPRRSPWSGVTWAALAAAIGLMTYRWPAALLLFTLALLWLGVVQVIVFAGRHSPAKAPTGAT